MNARIEEDENFSFRFSIRFAFSSRSTSVVVREFEFLSKHPRTSTIVEDDLGPRKDYTGCPKSFDATCFCYYDASPKVHAQRHVRPATIGQTFFSTSAFSFTATIFPLTVREPRSISLTSFFKFPLPFYSLFFFFNATVSSKMVPRNIARRRISSVVKRAARRLVVDY